MAVSGDGDAEMPSVNLQTPSSPDVSPDGDRFFDSMAGNGASHGDSCNGDRHAAIRLRHTGSAGTLSDSERLPLATARSAENLLLQTSSLSATPVPPPRRQHSADAPASAPQLVTTADASASVEPAELAASPELSGSRSQLLASQSDLGSQNESNRSSDNTNGRQSSSASKRARRTPWYSSLLKYSYKQRCDEFRKLFEVPADERLLVDYSCAQVDVGKMIYHGRLYVSQNYVCFVSNVIMWNKVSFCVPLADVRSITKMNVLVFPSGITMETSSGEKYVLSSFASRDRAYSTLENIWRHCVEQHSLEPAQLWHMVHELYGSELGLTSDDDDYVLPTASGENSEKTRRGDGSGDKDTLRPSSAGRRATGSVNGRQLDLENGSAGASRAPVNTPGPFTGATATLTRVVQNGVVVATGEESDTAEDDAAATLPPRCDGVGHQGRHVTALELPLHVDHVFTLLFTHSDFSEAFHCERKYYAVSSTEWQDNEAAMKVRCVRFQMDVNHPLGKTTTVTEDQTMSPLCRPGRQYQVDSEVNNVGVPMADVFYLTKHYCLTALTPTKSRLDIWCGAKFRKSTLFRGFIEKTANDGMDEHHAALNRLLVETVGDGGKHKRPKRRHNTGKLGEAGTGEQMGRGGVAAGVSGASGVAGSGVGIPGGGAGGASLLPGAASSGIGGGVSERVMMSALVMMLLLLLLNGYMYVRMTRLSAQTELLATRDPLMQYQSPPPPASRRETDWLQLMRRQQELHRAELVQWKRVVGSVTCLLKQTEAALTRLHHSVESYRLRAELHQTPLSDAVPPWKPGAVPDAMPAGEPLESCDVESCADDGSG